MTTVIKAESTFVRLRTQATLFTIILGDFGREAATRYAALLAAEERSHVAGLLAHEGQPFYDEYRRIMFSLVGDVSFLKKTMIDRAWMQDGRLGDGVLVAVHDNPVPLDLVERLAVVIRDEAIGAAERGHQRVRVSLVCNALSEVLQQAVNMAVGENIALIADRLGFGLRSTYLSLPDVSAHGVVQASLCEMRHQGIADGRPLLVLGARMARSLYSEWGRQDGFETIEISESQQEVIDEAVLMCVDGDRRRVIQARQALEQGVVSIQRRRHPDLEVLEACTDFNFGIGHDSVRLMAQALVREAYASE